jgi:hypothetical protein
MLGRTTLPNFSSLFPSNIQTVKQLVITILNDINNSFNSIYLHLSRQEGQNFNHISLYILKHHENKMVGMIILAGNYADDV